MAQRGTKAKIDLVELEKLCAMQATDAEIAGFFNVSERTILRRKKTKKIAAVMERGRAKGRLTVRRAQLKMLEEGNATMGVWLGKQILQQTDFIDYRGEIAVHSLAVVMSPKSGGVEQAVPVTIDLLPRPAGLLE